ncbi:MAG: type I-MYXAN CRISPR-associated protein Cmx8 [Gammaproteobacteria bacterium]
MNPEMTLLDDGRLRLDYALHDLPSAQHKAGLAGMVFLARSLQSRAVEGGIELIDVDDAGACFEFGPEQLRVTLEDLYAARWQELASKSKFTGKPPKRIDDVPVTGDNADKSLVCRPMAPAIGHLLKGVAPSPWLKLWQDMLWAVLRAQPKTRTDYEKVASKEPLALPDAVWKRLLKVRKAREKGGLVTDSVSGAYFVGAQARNAEGVAFQGSVELNLLLQFWTLVTPLFVPRTVDVKNHRTTDQGYLLAIPDVADLAAFVNNITAYWKDRGPEIRGYRPEQAVIDVPVEGGMEFLHEMAQRRSEAGFGLSVSAIDWYHLEKQGKSVRMHGHGRLPANPSLLKRYEEVRDRRADPLYKQLLIGNLIAERPWYEGAARLCSGYPAEFFIRTPKTPRFSRFGANARRRFIAVSKDANPKEDIPMSDSSTAEIDDELIARIYDLVGVYLLHRAIEKGNIKEKKPPKDGKRRYRYPRDYGERHENGGVDYPQGFREAVEKAAKETFLAMRGRNEREFVTYFTGTICSVPQFFRGERGFVAVATALIDKHESIKDVAMLALSAHSWLGGASEDDSTPATDNDVAA